MLIREETPADRAAVRLLIEAAFGGATFGCNGEAGLVERLREEQAVILSLVAEVDGEIAGHILFSRMWIEQPASSTPVVAPAVALAPVAVSPRLQRKGIGSSLIRAGLERLRQQQEDIVLVLGEPAYYTRFGFSVETARGLESPFPPDAFMGLELRAAPSREWTGLGNEKRKVRYPAAFGL